VVCTSARAATDWLFTKSGSWPPFAPGPRFRRKRESRRHVFLIFADDVHRDALAFDAPQLPVFVSLIISPTYKSNYAQFKRLGVAQDDILDPDDKFVVEKVVDIVNAERDDLLEYRQKLAMLKELKANIKNTYDLQENYGLFSEFIGLDGNWITPEHKWGGRKPKLAVFVDDAQSTAIFRNRQFLNLTTRSRHQGSMPGDEASIGISMIIGVQNYTATGGGLPKAVRGNATHMALWRTKNKDELNLIAKEFSGEVDVEKFMEVYEYIMSDEEDRHVMMFVDLHKKDTHPSMFRRSYLDFVVM
jgi:hypothetical protein